MRKTALLLDDDLLDRAREVLEPLFIGGEVATCGVVDLELLFSARGSRAVRVALRRRF